MLAWEGKDTWRPCSLDPKYLLALLLLTVIPVTMSLYNIRALRGSRDDALQPRIGALQPSGRARTVRAIRSSLQPLPVNSRQPAVHMQSIGFCLEMILCQTSLGTTMSTSLYFTAFLNPVPL